MLEFDDSCESHIKNAIPELKKRGMVGTFYINPGNGPYKNKQAAWEKDVPAAGMELAMAIHQRLPQASLTLLLGDAPLGNGYAAGVQAHGGAGLKTAKPETQAFQAF